MITQECELCGKMVDRLYAVPSMLFLTDRTIVLVPACSECAAEREPLLRILREAAAKKGMLLEEVN